MRKFPELLYRAFEKGLWDPICTLWAKLLLRIWGAAVGTRLRVSGRMRLRISGELVIGDGVRIQSGYTNFVGAAEPMAIWVSLGAHLNIGDACGLSNLTIVCLKNIDILEGTFIGGGSRIYDTDFHQIAPEDRISNRGEVPSAPIRIGPRAFVGGHCIILKGVTIGEGSVIGAGSVVTRDVPAFEVWAGIPARKLRELWRP